MHVTLCGADRTGAQDSTAAIQDAVNRSPVVYFQEGKYRISAPLKMQPWTCLIGEHGRCTTLQGTHSGVLLLYPTDNVQCRVQSITLAGAGCTAVAVDTALPGPLRGYLNQFRMRDCNIARGMSFGINAAMLCCHIEDTTFGYVGGDGDRVGCAIRSHAFGTNAPNLNCFTRLVFNHCGNDLPAVELHGGVSAAFAHCDWEGCSRVLRAQSMAHVSLADCWLERNSSPDWLIYAGESYTPLEVRRTQFQGNDAPTLIECDDLAAAGIDLRNNFFGLEGNGYPVRFASARTSELLPGKLVWENNHVTGGSAGNDLTTGVNRMDRQQVQGWARVNMEGATFDSHSDANGYVTRHDVGEVSVTMSTPFCTSIYAASIVGNAADADGVMVRAWATATDTIRVRSTRDGSPIDCVVSVQWAGK